MKKIFSYFMIFMCLLGTSVVTSCSSDDDNEEDKLADLPYENEAAIYQVTDTESRISYIELTSNGNYIIEYKSMVVGSSAYNVKDNFEYGTFKKSADNTYQLNDKNSTILKIASTGGSNYTVTYGSESYPTTKLEKKATYLGANHGDLRKLK